MRTRQRNDRAGFVDIEEDTHAGEIYALWGVTTEGLQIEAGPVRYSAGSGIVKAEKWCTWSGGSRTSTIRPSGVF